MSKRDWWLIPPPPEAPDFGYLVLMPQPDGAEHTVNVHNADDARLIAAAPDMAEALDKIEQILGFHEGSQEPKDGRGKPVVWINAQGKDGDLQVMLADTRAALRKAGVIK